jgi:hypothetical protein
MICGGAESEIKFVFFDADLIQSMEQSHLNLKCEGKQKNN